MYVYTLLSIFALLLAVECGSLWNMFTDILDNIGKYEDAHLNINQLIFKYGYDFEEHQVVTEDSYVINFHRIPNENGPVVFLMHGIADSADCWILQGPSISLGYLLADEGFDVWMGNARGNKYCTKHAFYNHTSEEFWKFTWEEIGLYDLPAMIDYILNVTGRESLYYIGHSQGTTISYVLLSMKPEYNQKINLMISLAPVAWMGNVKSPIVQTFSSTANELSSVLDYSILSSGTDLFHKVSPYLCTWLMVKCENILFTLMGHEHRINDTLWPIIFGHVPTGSSTLQLVHYGQLVNSNRFCRFDYGVENIDRYGQATPSDYNISMIEVPVVLYYSDKDLLSDVQDVMKLKSKLTNVLDNIFLSDFGHLDYLYAADAYDLVYNRIIGQIRKFEKDVNST